MRRKKFLAADIQCDITSSLKYKQLLIIFILLSIDLEDVNSEHQVNVWQHCILSRGTYIAGKRDFSLPY